MKMVGNLKNRSPELGNVPMLREGKTLNETRLLEKVTGKKDIYRGTTSRSTRKHMKKSIQREARVETSVPS